MEASHGSLGRAMLAARKRMAQTSKAPAKPLFTSLKDGMQQLVDAVVSRVPVPALRTNTAVQNVQPNREGWTVSADDSNQFDAIIVATPAQTAAALLRTASLELASELGGIQYTSSVTVNLGYDRKVRDALPPGFGFLVPRSEGKCMLAATFVHNKFPNRAPDDRALLRCFVGGARNEQILQTPDEELIRIIREEVHQVIGLMAEPLFTRVYRWRGAMAQYGVGHLERLQRIETRLQQIPGLTLAGNGYRGIGVPDCVRSGTEAAKKALLAVGLSEAAAPVLSH
jgi:oxygen-dependent protoporphyrinogen oxidase